MELQEIKEQCFDSGHKAAYRKMLSECIRELNGEDLSKEKLIVHLAETRSALRTLCENFGDNDWDDDLHLADVINNHLANHLHSNRK